MNSEAHANGCEPVLELRALSKSFGGLRAVRDVTLKIMPGDRKAIIGPNGAGKTTLFNLITGILPASSGRVLLFGQDVTRWPSHRRTALGCGIGCAVAARVGLLAVVIPREMLRVTSACATVVVLGMAGIAFGTAVYLLALTHDAPGLAGQGNGPLELLSVGASLAIQLAVMLIVLVPAGIGAVRARG